MAESTFMGVFHSDTGIHSADFIKMWLKYDTDTNSYIEAGELDNFLKDYMKDEGNSGSLQEFKNGILSKFDVNYDGKLDLTEMVKLCPVENFITKISSGESLSLATVNKIFKHYDWDNSGSIDGNEISGLFRDLLERSGDKITLQKLEDYAAAFIEIYDKNKDGKLQNDELFMEFPIEDNFFKEFVSLKTLTMDNFNKIFQHYDEDNSESINGDEIAEFFTDLLEARNQDFDAKTVEEIIAITKNRFDENVDGKFQKNELMALLN